MAFCIERLSYDFEKSVHDVFHGPMFGKIKTKVLLISAKETPNMGSKQGKVTLMQTLAV